MRIGVIIPAYKVRKHISDLLQRIDQEVDLIVVVDDKCPEGSGKFVEENCDDYRVEVIYNEVNLGVGGAVKNGFRHAMTKGMDIFVKLDGDGQMSPELIKQLIAPILRSEADYSKGNRFYHLESLQAMPPLRIFGNSMLSLVNKFVNGYWDIMDPTNGFIAIHKNALSILPLDKIENRYFFESDMLFRLSTIRAVVKDMPMNAVYADEESNLSVSKTLFSFPGKYLNRFIKRIFYNYFLRDFNLASLEIFFGLLLTLAGVIIGIVFWLKSISSGIVTTSGQVMMGVVPFLVGVVLLLLALHVDLMSVPRDTIDDQIE